MTSNETSPDQAVEAVKAVLDQQLIRGGYDNPAIARLVVAAIPTPPADMTKEQALAFLIDCTDETDFGYGSEIRRAVRAIQRLSAMSAQAHASPREWQDIATAPKDGTVIDLWKLAPDRIHGRRIPDVRWDNNRSFNGGIGRVAMPDAWVHSLGGGEVYLDGGLFTHWMPLPEPARTALELG